MWQVASAKNRFSELLTRAETEGPQRVRRRVRTFVLPTEEQLEGMKAGPERKMSLGEYLLNAPKLEGLVIARGRSPWREIDLGPDDG